MNLIMFQVAFSTNYAGTEHFKATVTVNVTAMLVIATLFISDAKSLPKTSYMKMIDIWSICAMSVPFFEVVLLTAMADLTRRVRARESSKGMLIVDICTHDVLFTKYLKTNS